MKKKLKMPASLILAITILTQIFLYPNINNVKAAERHFVSYDIVKDNLGGFKLISKKLVEDLNCNAYIYEHVKSGAQLIFLDNKGEEKMFSVTFRTPSKDETGVNHIIEHSVLQGSKKYPVKDPFIQMSNRSLNTYLNAMTSCDFTMYPVSSKNSKDFSNLMKVYLDAVFYPNMVKDKRIFLEEGWRYELNSKEDDIKYNGIVYNEMKGNYSSPNRILYRAINQSLFPDTSYRYDAGGYPDDILKLTYEDFVKTYEKNYSPSNSYFFLCGDIDIKSTLKFIGEEYLNNFNKKAVNTELKLQAPFKEKNIKIEEYPVQENSSNENKTYFSSNYVISTALDKKTILGFTMLQQLLTEMPSSPLTKALRENGFSGDIATSFDMQRLQPVFSIIARNTNENQIKKFQKIIDNTLNSIVEKGFDKNLMDSVFNSYELSSRMVKVDDPLSYNILIMASWLYGGDPTLYLSNYSDFKEIKEKAHKGFFQELIKEYLIDNKHSSMVILRPSLGLDKKKEIETKNKLSEYKASLTEKNIEKLVKETHMLKEWQETPNSKEALASLPRLNREDINTKVKEYVTLEKKENGVKVLHHPIFTNGVDSITLYFDITKVPQEKIGYIYLLQGLLGKMDTENYNVEKLSEEIYLNSGGMSFSVNNFVKYKDPEVYYPKMAIDILSLTDKLPNNFKILHEIIYNTKLNDKARLKELINKMKTDKEIELTTNGFGLAVNTLSSYLSQSGRYDHYKNEEYYKFLCDLCANFENNSSDIISNLENVRDLIFNKRDMIVSYTGGKDTYKVFAKSFNDFSKKLSNKKVKNYNYNFYNFKVNEGLIAPSMVQYVAKGGNLKKAGYEVNGKLMVLQNILDSEYLWNSVRIKGGAYGVGMLLDNTNILFYSYRDPNLKETINAFNKIPEYLKNFNADEEQMTNYIVGTIGKLDCANDIMIKMMGPAAEGAIADNYYITGIKQSDIQKLREEIISTTAEDIRSLAKTIECILNQEYLCVVGGETKIRENKDQFIIINDVLN